MKSARRPKERSYSPYEISEPVCKTRMDFLGETLGLKTIFFLFLPIFIRRFRFYLSKNCQFPKGKTRSLIELQFSYWRTSIQPVNCDFCYGKTPFQLGKGSSAHRQTAIQPVCTFVFLTVL